MHFYDFLQLNEDEQLELLWYNGEQIGRRKVGEYLILLYQVEGFYVEVFYHTKSKVIKKYLSFESLDKLEPYLDTIDISAVYRYMKRQPKKTGRSLIDDLSRMASTREEYKSTVKSRPAGKIKSRNTIWSRFLSIFK